MICYIVSFQKTDKKVSFADTIATFFQEASVENQITNSTNNPLSLEGISCDDSNDTITAKEPDDVGVDVGQTGTGIKNCDSTHMIQHDNDLNSSSRGLEILEKEDQSDSQTIGDEIDVPVSHSKNEQLKTGITGVKTISREPEPTPSAHCTNHKSISTVMLVEGNDDDKQNSIDGFTLANTEDVFSGCEHGLEHCLTSSLISDQEIKYPEICTEEKDVVLQQETE
mgnify:FL=1